MAKKVLLVQPYHGEPYVTIPGLWDLEPLALEVLAGSVQDLASVKILDRRKTKSSISRALKEFSPDILGVTTGHAGQVRDALQILSEARDYDFSIKTVAGGMHASLMPETFFPRADCVVKGGGESTFRELVQTDSWDELERVKGLLLPSGIYTGERKEEDFSFSPCREKKFFQDIVITSRGCPNRCNYCGIHEMHNGRYQERALDEIIEELESSRTRYIFFGDDNTFADVPRMIELAARIKEKGIKKYYSAYARPDSIVENPELFKNWRDIGLRSVVTGVEAVETKRLAEIKKGTEVSGNREQHRILSGLGILEFAHFLLFPDFRRQDFNNLYDYCEQNKIYLPFFVPLTPIPGTTGYKQALAENRLSTLNFDYYNFEYMVYHTDIPKNEWYKESEKLWKKAYGVRRAVSGYREPFKAFLNLGMHILLESALERLEENQRVQLSRERLASGAR